MPVVFGPTLRRLAGEEQDAPTDEEREERPERTQPGAVVRRAATKRWAALAALLAGAAGWVAMRRLRPPRERGPAVEPPFSR